MNYISQINGFWNWRQLNELTSRQADLYMAILHCSNRCGWKQEFNVPNSTLQSLCDSSKNELHKARNVLVQKGLIKYSNGKKGSAGNYEISLLYDTNVDTKPDTNVDTNVDTKPDTNQGTIPKQEETKPKKENIMQFWELAWGLYPNKKGKGQVSDAQKARLQKIGLEELTRCIERYKKAKPDWQHYQNGSTFFNSGYVDYLDKNHIQDDLPKNGDRREDGRIFMDGKWVLV